jgi:acyl dehydratase
MARLVLDGIDALRARTGTELGVSGWHEITQAVVDAFADVTGDRQWIHVDRERAAASPFRGTIAHGYLTLALASRLGDEIFALRGFSHVLNYGLERVRFPAPLPVGSRVRMRAALASVTDIPGGVQVAITNTFEREGFEKPVCAAETLRRLYL